MKTKKVVTYRLAYVDEDVDLCAQCAETHQYPLGPVLVGAHTGICDGTCGDDCVTYEKK